jgi:SAM-dependent methyltransferase
MKNNTWEETKIVKNFRGNYTVNSKYGIGSYLVSRLTIKHLFNFLNVENTPKNVLDVGCGYMPHYVFFKDNLDYTSYVGVDWENSPHKSGNVDYLMNLNEPLFIEGSYDLILLMDVIEHLQDVSILFNSLKNNLNESGFIYITVPFYYWIHEAPFDYNRYSIFQLKSLLNRNGFEIVDYKIVGGFGTSLIDLISKNVFGPLKLNSLFARNLLYLTNKLFEKLGLNKNKETYPIEYIIKISHL